MLNTIIILYYYSLFSFSAFSCSFFFSSLKKRWTDFYEMRNSRFSWSKGLCSSTYSSLLLLLFILSRWGGFDRGTRLGGTQHVLRWIDYGVTVTVKTLYVLHEKSSGKCIIYRTVSTYRSSRQSPSSCTAVWDGPPRGGSKLELAMATNLQATLQK